MIVLIAVQEIKITNMTFSEILEHFKNHELIRRDFWFVGNAIKLSEDNFVIGMFRVYKNNVYLPIDSVYSIYPIFTDDENSTNITTRLHISDLVADDWSVFDESKTKECPFLLRNLNKETENQLMAINKLKIDFDSMSDEEKQELYEKYPDLIIKC